VAVNDVGDFGSSRDARQALAAAVTFDVVDARSTVAQWAMSSYFAELDATFPTGFDPGDALTSDAESFDPPAGRFLIVHHGDLAIGCGGIHSLDRHTGEIKRMWISPDWRGLGLAPLLLARLEQHSCEIGHRSVRLDTNASLLTAIRMYERQGYRAVARYNDNPYAQRWFEKILDLDH
jgi:GNAT superfamily N-acetyltransferase